MRTVSYLLERFQRLHGQWRRWYKLLIALGAVVVFATTYAMVLPALTLDKTDVDHMSGISLAPATQPVKTAATNRTVAAAESSLAAQNDTGASAAASSALKNTVAQAAPQHATAQQARQAAAPAGSKHKAIRGSYNDNKLRANTKKLTCDGGNYSVTLNYSKMAGIPAGSKLKVKELTKGSKAYKTYYKKASKALQAKDGLSYARFFDVKIKYKGKTIEPKASVDVQISYDKPVALKSDQQFRAVHFVKKGSKETPEVLTANTTKKKGTKKVSAVKFKQDSFSVVGTVVADGSWPSSDGDYILVLQKGTQYFALNHNATCTAVSVSGNKVNFVDNISDTSDYQWYVSTPSGDNTKRTISTTSTSNAYLYPMMSPTYGTPAQMSITSSGKIYGNYRGSDKYLSYSYNLFNSQYKLKWESSDSNAAKVIFASAGTGGGSQTEYTVTYNANGGSGTLPESVTVTSGGSVTLATNGLVNSNANLVANGWNTKADGTGTHYMNGQSLPNIQSNITLYAEW
ncbi:MAG: InlB B-repeat-containing protein [Anaerovoracaceae bacterium]|jgi:hypothetical protein